MQRRYIYPYLTLEFTLQLELIRDAVVIRTFRPSGGALNGKNALTLQSAEYFLSKPVTNFISTRATPEDSWIPRTSLKGNWIVGSIYNEEVGSYLQEVSQISLELNSDILGRAAISEHAEWMIPCDVNGNLSTPINRILLTRPSRSKKSIVYYDRKQSPALSIMLPYADTNFDRAIVYAKMNPAYGLIHNMENAKVVSPDGLAFDGYETIPAGDWAWPVLKVSGPDTIAGNAFAQYMVHLHDGMTGFALDESGMRVDLESSAGYLAHRVLHLQDGRAGFALGALGLAAGDRIKLKAGWRNYPGVCEKEITVV